MSKRRLKLQVGLGELPPDDKWPSRTATAEDRQALAELLIAAYSGTIDDEGETPAEALAEIEGPLGTLVLGQDYRLVLQDGTGTHAIDCAPAIPAWGEAPWHGVQDSVIRFQSHVVEVLNGRTDPQPSGEDNLKTLALCLAAYDAVARRQTIDMSTWEEAPR